MLKKMAQMAGFSGVVRDELDGIGGAGDVGWDVRVMDCRLSEERLK